MSISDQTTTTQGKTGMEPQSTDGIAEDQTALPLTPGLAALMLSRVRKSFGDTSLEVAQAMVSLAKELAQQYPQTNDERVAILSLYKEATSIIQTLGLVFSNVGQLIIADEMTYTLQHLNNQIEMGDPVDEQRLFELLRLQENHRVTAEPTLAKARFAKVFGQYCEYLHDIPGARRWLGMAVSLWRQLEVKSMERWSAISALRVHAEPTGEAYQKLTAEMAACSPFSQYKQPIGDVTTWLTTNLQKRLSEIAPKLNDGNTATWLMSMDIFDKGGVAAIIAKITPVLQMEIAAAAWQDAEDRRDPQGFDEFDDYKSDDNELAAKAHCEGSENPLDPEAIIELRMVGTLPSPLVQALRVLGFQVTYSNELYLFGPPGTVFVSPEVPYFAPADESAPLVYIS